MKKVMSVAVASVLFGSVGVCADVPEAEWREFKEQYAALANRVNALEAENQKLKAMGVGTLVTVEDLSATNEKIATLEKQNKSTSWAEDLKWKGDFRYRYEDIEEDGRSDRNRNRIRARAELVATPSDTTEVGLAWLPVVTTRCPPTRPWVAAAPPKTFASTWDTCDGRVWKTPM